MSKKPSNLVRRFCEESQLGAFVLDLDIGTQKVDGLIFSGTPVKELSSDEITLSGRDVILIQKKLGSKRTRLGMRTPGHAIVARERLMKLGAKPIRTVMVCRKGDSVIQAVAEKFGIETVEYADAKTS